ncbi:tRNA1(Val) (adenine(37)-N6)-methyltransferase [Shimia sp. FJ5]|uniref:tRNA1(Val) (adenine(37)-N6)-methyltransferase n=1 Tax=Shimia sp. FJ5 TaxID=3079054 RepID=UPI002609D053|nr:methyltransferase domain-containing protein [Shimia sp. FJ5]MDV4145030.1 methyltransferase [Shimia sp. FJ5]
MSGTSENAYLGGRLTIRQPAQGYRAGVDPVLLAAATEARAGDRVLELGCGVGTAALCLAARVPGLAVTGVELQADYAALARENAAANGLPLEVIDADIAALPETLRQQQFTQVIANPPYFDRNAGSPATDAGRETAMGEALPLETWVDIAARRLAPKGIATFIHRAERLPDLLCAMRGRLGSLECIPLQPRARREAKLILLRGRKNGRAAFRIHAPVVMHEGATHEKDGDDYTPEISAVLRDGAALPFPK